jgi:RNA polymerase sigma factor (sigma-70 family)
VQVARRHVRSIVLQATSSFVSGLTSAEVTDLYRRYGFFLRRRCLLLIRDTQLADDAMHEAFVRLLLKGGPLREATHPLAWIHRVVDQCCFDQLRRGKRLRGAESLGDEHDRIGSHPGVALEIRDAVLGFLRELDERDQSIAVMAFVDGMSQGEIAEELGVSRITVNKRVQGIRERAGRALGDDP